MLFLIILLLILFLVGFFFIGRPPRAEKITFGINFSQKHSQNLGLDWKEAYLAFLDDLEVKNIKLLTHWDLIESEKDKYTFEDLDWQIEMAEEKGANLILVIGIKTGRWPECHIPQWAQDLPKEEQQKEILEVIKQVILRYKDRAPVWAWQVENEAFFPFGECPWTDIDFLKKEIDLVKSLDSKPIIISDSGEFSFWIRAARLGDMVGTTLHRRAWFKELGIYVRYPFTPSYYWRRAEIIRKFFGKKVISVELQAEPWGPTLLYWLPLEEQEKTMNLKQFKKNIEFAEKTGLDTFYLWGAEWWYWMKVKQNQPEIWQEAKKLFVP
ncbi:MAG TPA: endo-1,4-beta-xylanase [Candidatus Humimicrobiaceae bacterium]|nr:endo-1,4-beta-xylanase [Candidatus Humimicrobiaceae bacterium]